MFDYAKEAIVKELLVVGAVIGFILGGTTLWIYELTKEPTSCRLPKQPRQALYVLPGGWDSSRICFPDPAGQALVCPPWPAGTYDEVIVKPGGAK